MEHIQVFEAELLATRDSALRGAPAEQSKIYAGLQNKAITDGRNFHARGSRGSVQPSGKNGLCLYMPGSETLCSDW